MERETNHRPIIGITMGDGAGVGPEIIAKTLIDTAPYDICRPLIIGDWAIMTRAAAVVKAPVTVRGIADPSEARFVHGTLDVLDLQNLPPDLPFSRLDARAGKAAYEYLERAVSLAMNGELDAIATAPLHKEALKLGGCPLAGHTEILASLSGAGNYAMMLVSRWLRVIHVSTHVSLREACDLVKKDRILRVIRLADEAMRLLGTPSPRIAVAALNPHAGEGGLFGREEIAEILPAIFAARAAGLDASGPLPPDTVFYRAALQQEFDIVVVMYHDQGHIPLKLQGFADGVNVTVGLPFIRTSVDHGTAFDLAGQGTADPGSMAEALRLAAHLVRRKEKQQ